VDAQLQHTRNQAVKRGPAVALVDEEPDADLVARVASGDMPALGMLYDRHRAAVLRFAARASGNLHDADDLTHATFLTAAKVAAKYDGRISCRPWLIGIAARTLSHRRRGSARLANFLERLGRMTDSGADDVPASLLARSDRSRLQSALSKLSDAKRVVLIMFEVEGMSGEEIALALAIPVGTVWTRLHAARRELRAMMEPER